MLQETELNAEVMQLKVGFQFLIQLRCYKGRGAATRVQKTARKVDSLPPVPVNITIARQVTQLTTQPPITPAPPDPQVLRTSG